MATQELALNLKRIIPLWKYRKKNLFNKEFKKNIRFEVGSVADTLKERPVFQKLIEEELKENDLLLVTKIDRCSRNTLEFLKLQEKLFNKSVTFIALDLPYSKDMAVNKLISTNLAAISTFENERRKERQGQGISAAKKAGKYAGRKTVITKKLIDQVQDLKENKNLSITQIANYIFLKVRQFTTVCQLQIHIFILL